MKGARGLYVLFLQTSLESIIISKLKVKKIDRMTRETSYMQLTDYIYLLCVLGFDFSKYGVLQ